jgi:CzcA family heavy metal efflux pump
MIRSIVNTSLRFRLLVLGVALGVMAIGIMQLRNAPADVLPEFTPPYVEIQTEALGLSSTEVEQLITVPLEADLLNGVEGVDVIRSKSVPGLSSIVMVFEPGADLYRSRQLVQERLTQAHALPQVSQPPTMLQRLSSSSRLMMIGLSSDKLTPIERGVLARWTMKPRLMGVPGVANVAIWGQREQQLQVRVDPEQLREKNVTLSQVIKTTGNAQAVSHLSFLEASTPGTGGFVETPQQRLQVRNLLEELATPAQLARVPVEGTGGRLRLTDVANVVQDHQPLIGDAVVNNGDGLLLVVEKFPGANTLEVTKGVEEALDKLKPGLSGMQVDSSVFRPATFIEDAIDNLTLALIIAGVLIALALAAFLFAWRTLVIALLTIPLSLIAAALVLDLLGETFNAISFAGLAVALAIVIDDAVVGAESAARRMREHREQGDDASTAESLLQSTARVRSPMVYATLIALLAIVPVVVMQGRPGGFFEPLVLGYVLAVAAAMLVALTVTPALTALLFSRGAGAGAESPITRRLHPRYDGALGRFVRRPRAAFFVVGAGVIVGLAMLPLLGTSLIPSFKDQNVLVRLAGEPGTSQPKMTETARTVSRELRAIPGVDNVGAAVGRAVTGDRVVDVNSSELSVSIDSGADYDKTVNAIEDVVDRAPAAKGDVVTYSQQKIRDVGTLRNGEDPVAGRDNEIDALTGSDKPLVVRLYGQNSDVLRGEASKVRQAMSEVDGVVDPRVQPTTLEQAVEVKVDLAKAQRFGIKPGDVRRAEATLLQGTQVGNVFDDQKVFEVIVQGEPETRQSVSNIRHLLIDRPGGGHVRLGQVADVRVTPTPSVIERDAVSRRIDVEANVSGRSLGSVQSDVEDRLADLSLPLEYHAEVLKEATGEEIGTSRMVGFGIAAAIAAFLLLQAAFGSWRLAALVSLLLPIALVGGLPAVLIAGGDVSLGSLLGFLAVFGIATRNLVMLVRHFQDLEREEGEALGPELVRHGARDRLGPILTTTFALGLAAVPFVVLGSRPGLEVVQPMAVVILGGLVTSTLLSLFVAPALYLRFATPQAEVSDEVDLLHRWAGIEPAPAGAPSAVAEPVTADGDGNVGTAAKTGESESGEREPAV